MATNASDCDTFVVLLIDSDAATAGSGAGMYLVDNHGGAGGSVSEGGAALVTACGKGAKICWTVQVILPCSGDTGSFQIGNSNAWGFSGQPESAPDLAGAYTGQAQTAGPATGYEMDVQVKLAAGSLISPVVTPQILVKGPVTKRRWKGLAPFKPPQGTLVTGATPRACPNTMVLLALDADRFRASSGAAGAYLVDNRAVLGSTSEGSPSLATHCNAGDWVAFAVVPIDPYDGYTVTITAIDVSGGTIFPPAYAPASSSPAWWGGPAGSYWTGRAVESGSQSYSMTVRMDDGVSPYQATIVTPSITSS